MRSCESHYLARPESVSAATRAAIRDSMSLVGVEELKKEQSQAI